MAGAVRSHEWKESIIDSLGEEITGISAPVSICMALVVLLVKVLNPEGASDSSTVFIATIAYTEQPGDSAGQKLGGALLNAIIFVCVVAAMTFVLFFLFKYKCYKVIYGYMGFAIFDMYFVLTGAVALRLLQTFGIHIDAFSLCFILFNFSIVGVVGLFFAPVPLFLKQAYLVWTGIITAFLFTYIPEWTSWVLLALMAVYDLIAVLAPGGPLKVLVELAIERDQELPALVYEARPSGGRPYRRGWRQNRGGGAPDAAAGGAGGGGGAAAASGGVTGALAGALEVGGSPSHTTALLSGVRTRSSDEGYISGGGSSGGGVSRGGSGGGLSEPAAASGPSAASGRAGGAASAAGIDGVQSEGARGGGPGRPEGSAAEEAALPGQPEARGHGAGARGASRLRQPSRGGGGGGAVVPPPDAAPGPGAAAAAGPAAAGAGGGQGAWVDDQARGLGRPGDGLGAVVEVEDDESGDLPDAIKLGLGDFIFYSMLVGRAAMYDMMTVYSSFLAIIAGLGITLLLLAIARKALPALPVSIALGVAFYFLTRLVMEPYVVPLSLNSVYY